VGDGAAMPRGGAWWRAWLQASDAASCSADAALERPSQAVLGWMPAVRTGSLFTQARCGRRGRL
jgi:hypothetical protein